LSKNPTLGALAYRQTGEEILFSFPNLCLGAARGITMETTSVPKFCWICGEKVELEDCKVDGTGMPVHEKCYVARIALEKDFSPRRCA